MKKTVTLLLVLSSYSGFCCTTCNKKVQEMIFNRTFLPNLLAMLSAFLVLGVIVAVLTYISANSHKKLLQNYKYAFELNPVPLATAAMVLGIGIGGFTDGIVFHQILQWHEMLSNKLPPVTLEAKSVNMFWDGIFHAFTLIVVFIGTVLLWKLLKQKNLDKSGSLFIGGILKGWGVFNLVEGVINHHILGLHNVRESVEPDLWNYGFLASSILLLLVGYFMCRRRFAADKPH